jgi:hypothetical protein
MKPPRAGELVTITAGSSRLDAIVFDTPSRSKVVVAVLDAARGPVMRTVHPDELSERTAEGSGDEALRRLARRTPPPVHGAARGGAGTGHGRSGHARAAAHRPTGR